MLRTTALAILALFATTLRADAQNLPVSYVTDSTNDAVYRLADLSSDGDYNDAGEITVYYDDAVGIVPLQLNIGIEVGSNGVLFVCDSGEDAIFALEDLNADDDALDANEITTFFDGSIGGNSSAVLMGSAQDMCWDSANGVLWVINAGTSGNPDSIVRLQDLTADGDANDLGEALEYYFPAPGGAGGDSVPQDLALGANGELYYLEAGATGVLQKGVYRLEDLDLSGVIDQPNEVVAFYTPSDLVNGFPTHLMLATDGFWYMSDQLSDNVRRFQDTDMSGVVDAGSEDIIWYSSPSASILWEINQAFDGSFYCVESQTPDRVLKLEDLDMSGTIDQAGEAVEVYDDTLAAIAIGNPRGLALDPNPPASIYVVHCNGDGGDQMGCTDCPCANNAIAGSIGGCLNSSGVGSQLIASGSPSVSLPMGAVNDLRFDATHGPANQLFILNAGDALAPNDPANPCFGLGSGVGGTAFDGLRCAIVNTLRNGGRGADANGDVGATNSGWGGADNPPGGIAVFFGYVAGSTRFFQAIHRDSAMVNCGTGLNTTQAVEVEFTP